MTKFKIANYKLLAASASLALLMLTAQASAQCVDCAIYPNMDHLNGGETPAGKMGLEHAGGAASSYDPRTANASIQPRHHVLRPGHRSGTTRHRSTRR